VTADDEEFYEGLGPATDHLPRGDKDFFVAPTTTDWFNTLELKPPVVACWRLNRPCFAFDMSFIHPDAKPQFLKFRDLVKKHPGAPVALFGHADPSGTDEYNKKLSGRRARVVYATLVRDPQAWDEIYLDPREHDHWKLEVFQLVLSSLKSPSTGETYYPKEKVDGIWGTNTEKAVRGFQNDQGLKPASGVIDKPTRLALWSAYMEWLTTEDKTPPEPAFKMDRKDFIGAGADPKGKGALQGCSEFNPVLRFSQADEAEYAKNPNKSGRDERNFPNRRTVAFLFKPGTTMEMFNWPCPRYSEDMAGCKAQFYPDGDKRRNPQEKERRYQKTLDTMACKFYDEVAMWSPCEGGVQEDGLLIRLHDRQHVPMTNVPYRTTVLTKKETGTSATGWVKVKFPKGTCTAVEIEWGPPGPEPDEYTYYQEIWVNCQPGADASADSTTDDAAGTTADNTTGTAASTQQEKGYDRPRLNNIGNDTGDKDGDNRERAYLQSTMSFQLRHGMKQLGLVSAADESQPGELPEETRERLREIYGPACIATPPASKS
jgi:peptidoglycan hydrolase-like protein with peptidoglycan-binding domain